MTPIGGIEWEGLSGPVADRSALRVWTSMSGQ